MILSALQALKSSKGTSRHALSKHIYNSYSDLPPTHSSLLSHALRRLQSKGLIRMSKHSYKLADEPDAVGSTKKRGRPRKITPLTSDSEHVTKKRGRGRPPKVKDGEFPAKEKEKEKEVDVGISAAVYILPQAEQLKSGFLRSLPGAVAIVLPEGLLSKKTAKSPVLILPNGVQSLVDVSVGKKLGRPRKNVEAEESELVEERRVGAPRRKVMRPKQVVFRDGEEGNVGARKVGRPRKVRENGELKTADSGGVEGGVVEKDGSSAMPENVVVPEVKKRLVGRPKKVAVVEGAKTALASM